MTTNELKIYLAELGEQLLGDMAEIVAATATEYFRESFRTKSFDGNPWTPAKSEKHRGSLLIDSGALLNSIQPALISRERVVISAGGDKIAYAQAHNEGFDGVVNIPAHTRQVKPRKVHVPDYTTAKGRTVKAHTWALKGGE